MLSEMKKCICATTFFTSLRMTSDYALLPEFSDLLRLVAQFQEDALSVLTEFRGMAAQRPRGP